jgi:recombination protein RecA
MSYRQPGLAPQILGCPRSNAGYVLANNGEAQKKEGNTVGSLTERQKAIIFGCLLGDGAMRCKTNALLEINHSIRQSEYVEWKYNELKELVSTKPHKRRGNAGRVTYRFTTRSLPELTEIYRKFYAMGKKIIPDDLILQPLSLAVWFMDDGCKSYRAIYLNTQKFSISEQRKLASLLKEQFEIHSSLNKDKKYYRLRIAVSSVGRFLEIIKPYLLPMFCYKTP